MSEDNEKTAFELWEEFGEHFKAAMADIAAGCASIVDGLRKLVLELAEYEETE